MTQNLNARLNPQAPAVLSVFRIVVGLLFLLHGTSKLFGWPGGPQVPVGTWPFWFAGVIELVAGVLITVGFFTRPAAFIAAGEMAVAFFWQHLPGGFWPINNGGEVSVLFCFAFLLLVFSGPGPYAVESRRAAGGVVTRRAPRRGWRR
ncbi:MAG: DoxX family protein [Mycobacterium sp.]|jgi:putative oxidoreductase|nr:DoxX family protein [Mycobacterium sp.]